MKRPQDEKATQREAAKKTKPETAEDIVEETSLESFPASDAPGWNGGQEHRQPAGGRKG